MPETLTQPPACIFCGHERTIEVTAPRRTPSEGHYKCPNCYRLFAVHLPLAASDKDREQ